MAEYSWSGRLVEVSGLYGDIVVDPALTGADAQVGALTSFQMHVFSAALSIIGTSETPRTRVSATHSAAGRLQFEPPNADAQSMWKAPEMPRWMKPALVLAGYALAFAASAIAVALYDRGFSPADSQAMGGMIAGGEMMLGAGVFGLVSIVPTGLALWFLRGSRRFWSAFSAAGLAFAIAGMVAVLILLADRGAMARVPALVLVEFLGLVHMLGSPIGIGSFLLFAALAPAHDLRRRMLVAAAIEGVIGACGLVHFLVTTAPI